MSLLAQKLELLDLLASRAAVASAGARELRRALGAAARPPDGAERLHALRGEGAIIAGRCFAELRRSFATPLDREVIERLTTSLQGALDMLDEAAARIELYRLESVMPEAEQLAELLLGALTAAEQAIGDLRRLRHADRVLAACDRVEGLAQQALHVVRGARARLFREEPAPLEIVKWGDVLDHIAAAAARCRDAARTIEAVTVDALS